MKKFFLILLFVLFFSSCGISDEIPEEPAPGISASEPENEKEPVPLGGKTEKSDNELINEVYAAAEEKLITYAENAYWIGETGVSPSASNVIVNENGSLTFDLTLRKDGREITRNMRGFWLYKEDYEPNLNWGGYCTTANGHFVVCGIDEAFIINPYDFSVLDIDFDLESLTEPENDLWVNGVIYDENEDAWIISAGEHSPDFSYGDKMNLRIFVFDGEGNYITEYDTGISAIYGGWAGFATPSVAWKCTVLRKNGETLYSFGNSCFFPESGKSYYGSSVSEPYDAYDGNYSVNFYHCYSVNENSIPNYHTDDIDLGYYAVLKYNENIIDFFPTGEEYIEVSWDDETGEQTLELAKHEGRRFTLENPYFAKTMELDFEKGEYSVSYDYTEENLMELIADSADKTYSLWQAGIRGGGEAYFYEVALKNNKTGEIHRIAPNGTHTGRFFYEGFLKNGDFYVFCSNGLKIYDPKTVETVFDIEENFSLENRMLYTFRRNPDDFSYIIVYSDFVNGGEYDEESWPYLAPYTIKIGYLDKEGNLLESFDSGIRARYGDFGLESIEMRYSENELLFATSGGKGFNGIEFRFDRINKTFSEPVESE